MLDVLILVVVAIIGIAFFRKKGERGLTIQFPTATNQKGLRTRRNGFIILAAMVGAIIFVQIRSENSSLWVLAVLALGAVLVLLLSNKRK